MEPHAQGGSPLHQRMVRTEGHRTHLFPTSTDGWPTTSLMKSDTCWRQSAGLYSMSAFSLQPKPRRSRAYTRRCFASSGMLYLHREARNLYFPAQAQTGLQDARPRSWDCPFKFWQLKSERRHEHAMLLLLPRRRRRRCWWASLHEGGPSLCLLWMRLRGVPAGRGGTAWPGLFSKRRPRDPDLQWYTEAPKPWMSTNGARPSASSDGPAPM